MNLLANQLGYKYVTISIEGVAIDSIYVTWHELVIRLSYLNTEDDLWEY